MEAKPIEWAILIATIIGVIATIAQPFISYWLETRRGKRIDELKKDLEKKFEEKIKNLKRERFKENMKQGESFAEFIIKFSKDMEKAGKKLGEKACPNCKNVLEKFFKENFELK